MKEIEPFLLKAWTAFEMFRRMGFHSDSIYFCTTPDLDIIVEIQAASDIGIRICGPDEHRQPDREAIEAKWRQFAAEIHTIYPAVLECAWEGSVAQQQAPQILFGLARIGIHPPSGSAS